MNENNKFISHMCCEAFKVPCIAFFYLLIENNTTCYCTNVFYQKTILLYFFQVDNVHKFEKKCLKGHVEPQWVFHDFLKLLLTNSFPIEAIKDYAS
jgi:hypothetical protein